MHAWPRTNSIFFPSSFPFFSLLVLFPSVFLLLFLSFSFPSISLSRNRKSGQAGKIAIGRKYTRSRSRGEARDEASQLFWLFELEGNLLPTSHHRLPCRVTVVFSAMPCRIKLQTPSVCSNPLCPTRHNTVQYEAVGE